MVEFPKQEHVCPQWHYIQLRLYDDKESLSLKLTKASSTFLEDACVVLSDTTITIVTHRGVSQAALIEACVIAERMAACIGCGCDSYPGLNAGRYFAGLWPLIESVDCPGDRELSCASD